MTPEKHILVVRLSAMGDVAMTIPILRILLETYPNVKITVVSRGFLKPLFQNLPRTEFLEAEVNSKHKGVLGLLRLAKQASNLKIDAVADLHQVLRTKIMNTYFKFKQIPIVKIDKGRKEKKKLVQANGGEIIPLKTTHQRYADVFSDLGFPIDLSYPIYPIKSKPSPLVQGLLDINKKYIGIAAFAAHHSKQYPLEKIKEILKYFSESGAYQILLFGGGQKEVEALDQLEKEYKNTINLAGKFNLQTELEIIEQLDVMLSMDSGNGHLAALFDVPVLTLWGNTHPYAGFVPFNQPESHQIVADRGQFPLIPTSIYGNKMPEGYDKVMHSIPAELVIDKIKSLID